MAISLIRKNAAEVTAYDDTVMFDEAILNQNGILLNVGNQMSPYAEGVNFNIKDGYAILYGRQFKIEGVEQLTLTKPTSGYLYYLIYAKLDTTGSSESISLVPVYSTSDYPSTPTSNDLIKTRAGVAYLGLFTAKVSSTGIEEVKTIAPLIQSKKYVDDRITEAKTYTDNKDTNRKNYVDNKVTELNNLVTPFLSVKVINHSDGEQVNTIDINSLFRTGNEMYLLVILNIKDFGSTADSANNVDPNTFIAKLYSSATVTYRYNVKASSDSNLIARTNYQMSAGLNLLELRDDAGATIYTIQKVPNGNTIYMKALNDWMAQEIPLSTNATNKLIGRFNLYQLV